MIPMTLKVAFLSKERAEELAEIANREAALESFGRFSHGVLDGESCLVAVLDSEVTNEIAAVMGLGLYALAFCRAKEWPTPETVLRERSE